MNNSSVGRAGLTAGIVGLGLTLTAASCGSEAEPAGGGSGRSVLANQLFVGRAEAGPRLLSIRGVGRFRVACPEGRPRPSFRADGPATVHATVRTSSRSVRSAFLDPGELLIPPTGGRRSLRQDWQLSIGT